MRDEKINGQRLDPAMLEMIEVRAVKAFGLGEKLLEPGEILTVSRMRADYLRFLGLVGARLT